jgi:hypothetical protein
MLFFLVMACRMHKKNFVASFMQKFDADLALKDAEGFDVYERAAKDHFAFACWIIESETENINLNEAFVLELVRKQADGSLCRIDFDNVNGNCGEANYDTDLLPIDGYWEWCDEDWRRVGEDDLDLELFALKGDGPIYSRLRHRETIEGPVYFKEALELAIQRGDSDTLQRALKLLLEGLQHERNPTIKTRVATYFQRLLQYSEKNRVTSNLGLLENMSRSNLSITSESKPEGNRFVKLDHRNETHFSSDEESDDSLLYCPACSHRFIGNDRVDHLKRCMQLSGRSVIGDRYSIMKGSSPSESEECAICYEELKGPRSIAVMNCLCKFHTKCIEAWMQKGKQCPFHGNNNSNS